MTSRPEDPRPNQQLCSMFCLRLKLVGEAEHRAGKAMIVRVVSMLIKLAINFEDARPRGPRAESSRG